MYNTESYLKWLTEAKKDLYPFTNNMSIEEIKEWFTTKDGTYNDIKFYNIPTVIIGFVWDRLNESLSKIENQAVSDFIYKHSSGKLEVGDLLTNYKSKHGIYTFNRPYMLDYSLVGVLKEIGYTSLTEKISDEQSFLYMFYDLDLSEKDQNGKVIVKVSYIPQDKFIFFKTSILWDEETRKKYAVSTTPTKALNLIGITLNDSQLAEFIRLASPPEYKFKIVEGEEIRYWYNEKNYARMASDSDTLNSSCMRLSYTEGYLDVYTNNPDVVKMLIVTVNDKLVGRCLLWHTVDGDFSDKIYFIGTNVETMMEKYLDEKGYNWIMETRVTVDVGSDYDSFPYMDNMIYYNIDSGLLSNRNFRGAEDMQNSDGNEEYFRKHNSSRIIKDMYWGNLEPSDIMYDEKLVTWEFDSDRILRALFDFEFENEELVCTKNTYQINKKTIHDVIANDYDLLKVLFNYKSKNGDTFNNKYYVFGEEFNNIDDYIDKEKIKESFENFLADNHTAFKLYKMFLDVLIDNPDMISSDINIKNKTITEIVLAELYELLEDYAYHHGDNNSNFNNNNGIITGKYGTIGEDYEISLGFYYINDESRRGVFDLFEDIMKCGKNPRDKIHSRYNNLSYMLDDINEVMSTIETDDKENITNNVNDIIKKIYDDKAVKTMTKNIKDNMFALLIQRWNNNK